MLFVFFFNDTATTEIYTLSLHDALPIFGDDLRPHRELFVHATGLEAHPAGCARGRSDRKSTRLNSSHQIISYAVFCLKKKNNSSSHCHSAATHAVPTTLRTP